MSNKNVVCGPSGKCPFCGSIYGQHNLNCELRKPKQLRENKMPDHDESEGWAIGPKPRTNKSLKVAQRSTVTINGIECRVPVGHSKFKMPDDSPVLWFDDKAQDEREFNLIGCCEAAFTFWMLKAMAAHKDCPYPTQVAENFKEYDYAINWAKAGGLGDE